MADMKTQIKIEANTAGAEKDLKNLEGIFKDSKVAIEGTGNSLDDMSKSASDAGGSIKVLKFELEETGNQKSAIDQLSESLNRLGRSVKQLGMDLTKSITAPIAALAGISLKNLYDTGAIEGSTGPAREFALAVQDLRRNIKELSLEIGTTLAPIFSSLSNAVNNLITWFGSLDQETKKIIITVSLIASAIGPTLVALSGFISLGAKLLPIISAIGAALAGLVSFLMSPVTLIAALGASIAGLINVFLKLKTAGTDTATALSQSFNLFVTGFNNYVVGSLLKGISLITSGLSKLAGITGLSTKGIDAATEYVDGVISTLEKKFNNSKSNIDKTLEGIGTSAGEAFTFGLNNVFGDISSKLSGIFGSSGIGGQLESEMGKTFDSTFKKIEQLQNEHLLSLEQAQFEHHKKMEDMQDSDAALNNIDERFAREREFMEEKHRLQAEDLLRTIEEERAAAESIQDINKRRLEQKAIDERAALEVAKLTNQQEIESAQLANKQIEEATAKRWEKIQPYAQSFSQGLSNSFIEIAEGTKDMGKAFEDFAKNFLKQMAQMIIQAQILKAIQGMGLGFAEGGMVGPVRKYATGGHVRGPGSATSDSILARLSNGEFVSDARTVSHFGADFFYNLKKMARGGVNSRKNGFIPGFADGGLVTNPSQSPQVIIENKGSPSEIVSSSYDPSSAVIKVVIDDISKNGPVSKTIQSNFGLKRGGFR